MEIVEEEAIFIINETCLFVQTVQKGDTVYLDDKLIEKYDILTYGDENQQYVCLKGLVPKQLYSVSIEDHVIQIYIKQGEFSKTIIIVICSIFAGILIGVIGIVIFVLIRQRRLRKLNQYDEQLMKPYMYSDLD